MKESGSNSLVRPPKVVRAPGKGEQALIEARELVGSGQLVLVETGPRQPDLEGLMGSVMGPIAMPVALPPEKALGAVTAINEQGAIQSGTSWHHDQSFSADPPAWSALVCDSEGEESVPTVFCDGTGLYGLISPGLQSVLRSQRADHLAYYLSSDGQISREASAQHPVIVEVEGGKPAVFVSPANVEKFRGWSLQDSLPLLDHLFAMMNWPELVVSHYWRSGDLLIWPNRRYLHRALPMTSGRMPRELRRIVGRWA
jgi:alpha-ketoglutarate-dependent taurine dioxygenase